MEKEYTKEELIVEIKALISSKKDDIVEINPNYLEYFSKEELEEVKGNLLYKKKHYKKQTKEFVDELYEKTKKVEI